MNWAFISYGSGGTFSMKDALVRMNSRMQFFMIECSIQFSKPDQRLHHSRLSLFNCLLRHRSAANENDLIFLIFKRRVTVSKVIEGSHDILITLASYVARKDTLLEIVLLSECLF